VKIALVYLDALQPGGYPRDVRWLAGALVSAGHEVSLVAKEGRELDGLRSVDIVEPAKFGEASATADVVHFWGMFIPRQLLMLRRTKRHAVVLSPIAELMHQHMDRRAWKKRPYVATSRHLISLVRPTLHLFSEAEKPGVDRWLPQLPYFTATVGLFPPPPRSIAVPDKAPLDYLLFFGRNDVVQKGIDVLLEAYALAVKAGLDTPLVLAGSPQDRSESIVASSIARLGLVERVQLIGKVDEGEKWKLLRGARALVFLSRWDGPPRPIREAIAVGTPVIVSAGTNLADIVSRTEGGTGVGADCESAAAAMLLSQDGGTLDRWRANVPRLAGQLSWDTVAGAFADGYTHAVNRGRD
jgi:glycosyltransferase involved in cell wall biosynthesis